MNVFSCFDGISCGQLALQRALVKVSNYYASEIDEYAIKVTQKNFPNTIQLGSITEIDTDLLPTIDLLIGGSPCQGFSVAGKQLNFDDSRSSLFFEFVKLKNELEERNPNLYFLLENVKMKREWRDIITKYLGVDPVCFNSALVSAQNRQRYYWTNIPFVGSPVDKGILLHTVLESGVVDRDKSYCITSNYWKGATLEHYLAKCKKQVVFTERRTDEAKEIRRQWQKLGRDFSPRRAKELVPREDNKSNCLTTALTKEHILLDEKNRLRKLTPIECERLQTLPDNYTFGVSNTQRYRMLGNGWTVDMIKFFFMFLPESEFAFLR